MLIDHCDAKSKNEHAVDSHAVAATVKIHSCESGEKKMRLLKFVAMVSASLATAMGLAGCGHTQTLTVESLREIPSPPGMGSGQPNLALGPGGEVYLSWIDSGKGSPALKFATRKGDSWSQPQTIVQGEDLLVNYADYPSLQIGRASCRERV